MLNAKLVIVGGDSKTTEVKLKFPCIIGRGKGSTLVLPHPLVSRQHCELFEANGQLMVRDLGSLNGTYVNNEKIEEAIVPAGQLLTIGSVTFRAVYESPDNANGERKTEVVYPNTATVANAPPVATSEPLDVDADPEFAAEEFNFEAIAEEEPEIVAAAPVVVAESPPAADDFNMEIDVEELDDESDGISSEPLFAPDPPKTAPKAPAAKPVAAPPAKPIAARPTVTKPVAAPTPAPTVAAIKPAATVAKPAVAQPVAPVPSTEEKEEADDDLNDFLKSLNK